MSKVDEALKPCPFCGSEAFTHYHELEETWSVGCTICQAKIPYVAFTEAEATSVWNTRHRLAAQAEAAREIEALRAERDGLQHLSDELRRYIYDKTPERREKVVERYLVAKPCKETTDEQA